MWWILLAACLGPAQRALPPPLAEPAEEPVRIVLIGDTGEVEGDLPGNPARCEPGGFLITADCRARLRESIRAVDADLVVGLGDLVYWAGPTCRDGVLGDDARQTLDRALGSYLGDLGPPVWLTLGNHDLHQLASRPSSTACYVAYAEQHPTIEFPERTWAGSIGPVFVALIDSNRSPRGEVTEQLRAAVAAHRAHYPNGWVIGASHHPVRTYRDNGMDPDRMKRWVRRELPDVDLWASGHAHFLQLTVTDGIPNVTSGAGAKALPVKPCTLGDSVCGPGERFAWSAAWGFAVVEASADRLVVTFHDQAGAELFRWSRGHADPEGEPGPPGP